MVPLILWISLETRCSPTRFVRLARSYIKRREHELAIKELGLQNLLGMQKIKVYKPPMKSLLKNLDVESIRIDMEGSLITVRVGDIVVVLGIQDRWRDSRTS